MKRFNNFYVNQFFRKKVPNIQNGRWKPFTTVHEHVILKKDHQHVHNEKCSKDTSTCYVVKTVSPNNKLDQKNSLDNVESFYRKPLPSHLISFESQEGKKLFKEAMEAGYMEGYFSLASQFHTQSDPAFCGLGTLTMVLNSLSVDPERVWKGVWRWFSEELLNCCTPLEVIKNRGLSFSEFVCLARCNAANVKDYYASKCDVEIFRDSVKKATSTPQGQVVVATYDRQVLSQTGSGHFSPVGGYHPGKDLVLMMDVARFKYPPHWVPVSLLFEAMKPIDENTGRDRGFAVVSSGGSISTFCRIKAGTNEWKTIGFELWKTLPFFN